MDMDEKSGLFVRAVRLISSEGGKGGYKRFITTDPRNEYSLSVSLQAPKTSKSGSTAGQHLADSDFETLLTRNTDVFKQQRPPAIELDTELPFPGLELGPLSRLVFVFQKQHGAVLLRDRLIYPLAKLPLNTSVSETLMMAKGSGLLEFEVRASTGATTGSAAADLTVADLPRLGVTYTSKASYQLGATAGGGASLASPSLSPELPAPAAGRARRKRSNTWNSVRLSSRADDVISGGDDDSAWLRDDAVAAPRSAAAYTAPAVDLLEDDDNDGGIDDDDDDDDDDDAGNNDDNINKGDAEPRSAPPRPSSLASGETTTAAHRVASRGRSSRKAVSPKPTSPRRHGRSARREPATNNNADMNSSSSSSSPSLSTATTAAAADGSGSGWRKKSGGTSKRASRVLGVSVQDVVSAGQDHAPELRHIAQLVKSLGIRVVALEERADKQDKYIASLEAQLAATRRNKENETDDDDDDDGDENLSFELPPSSGRKPIPKQLLATRNTNDSGERLSFRDIAIRSNSNHSNPFSY